MAAMLDNACHRNAGMISRGEGHEPSVVAIFFRSCIFLDADTLGFLDYLSGAGFAGHDHVTKPGAMRGAVSGIDHANHPGANLFEYLWINMDAATDYRRENLDWRTVERINFL